jgi:hypothetical protein
MTRFKDNDSKIPNSSHSFLKPMQSLEEKQEEVRWGHTLGKLKSKIQPMYRLYSLHSLFNFVFSSSVIFLGSSISFNSKYSFFQSLSFIFVVWLPPRDYWNWTFFPRPSSGPGVSPRSNPRKGVAVRSLPSRLPLYQSSKSFSWC